MTYAQDKVPRQCAICERAIEEYQEMLDLFRAESAKPDTKQKLCWCHESCAKNAIEVFLVKRWRACWAKRVGRA